VFDERKGPAVDPLLFAGGKTSYDDDFAIGADEMLFSPPSRLTAPKRAATSLRLHGFDSIKRGRGKSSGHRIARSRPETPRRHLCALCGADFSLKKDAYRHKAANHDGATFPCHIPDCGAVFPRKDARKRHLDNERLHHEARAMGLFKSTAY